MYLIAVLYVWCGVVVLMYPELLSPCVSLYHVPSAHLMSSTGVCRRLMSCCVQSVVSVSHPDTHLQCCSISSVIMSSTYIPACLTYLLLPISRQYMSSTSCKNIQLQNLKSGSPLGCAPFLKPILCILFQIAMLWLKLLGPEFRHTYLWYSRLLTLFKLVRNIAKRDCSLRMSIRPSVRPSAWNNLAPTERIFMNSGI